MDIKILEKAREEKWNICTYGLGYLGKRLYREIPSIFGLSTDYFSDSNDSKVESYKLDGLIAVHRDDLLKTDQPTIVFILVDDPYDLEIQKMLSVNDKLYSVTLRQLAEMKEVIRFFYGETMFKKYVELPDYKNMSYDKVRL